MVRPTKGTTDDIAQRYLAVCEERDALRGEIKDLTRLSQSYLAECSEERVKAANAEAENERLRIQVEETARECGVQKTENERLLVDNAELSAECDQWGEKVASLWAEVAKLRAQIETLGR